MTFTIGRFTVTELAIACDLRFASREKAVFGQPEVGFGLIAGGGALARLPLLVGRSRAIEIALGGDDFDAVVHATRNSAIELREGTGFKSNRDRFGDVERPALLDLDARVEAIRHVPAGGIGRLGGEHDDGDEKEPAKHRTQ